PGSRGGVADPAASGAAVAPLTRMAGSAAIPAAALVVWRKRRRSIGMMASSYARHHRVGLAAAACARLRVRRIATFVAGWLAILSEPVTVCQWNRHRGSVPVADAVRTRP